MVNRQTENKHIVVSWIGFADIPGRTSPDDPYVKPLGDGFSVDSLLESITIHYIGRARDEARGCKTKAARLLGLNNYQTLDGRLKKLKKSGQENNNETLAHPLRN